MENDQIALLGLSRVKDRTSLSKTTIYRLVSENKFPRPYQLTLRRVAWREADISAWLAGRGEA